ncbi:MAG TPA: imidazole glycerol phosphate synthase subunit HisH [Thiobacillaceae bacterium]|nr:imidazole glycerol phosphate synthase subunit HisH [Thiobacillaceae bacterium]
MSRVAIVDYGMGNLRSVANALRQVGTEPAIVDRPEDLTHFERVILPGVGAFQQAMEHLDASGLGAAVDGARRSGKPILGICLGMQLMCRGSEEGALAGASHAGLGWVDAQVRRFPVRPGLKVPHMGWDDVQRAGAHPLIEGVADGSDYYFVHSYYVDCAHGDDVLLAGDYGVPYCAVFAHGNVVGAQFHPEKSQQAGLRLLKNFLAWTPC